MDINMRIKEVKERVKTLTKHFPYEEYEINLITLAYIAITMLDPTIEDMIDEAISNTFIFLTNKSVPETYEMLFPNIEEYRIDDLRDADAISSSYELNSQGKFEFCPFIIIEKNISINSLLDSILHELKHRINEIIPKFDNNSFYSGLNFNSQLKVYYYNIDEAFNSYLVKIYLNNLLALKHHNIEDVKIREILSSLSGSISYSYYDLVKLCLPLFQSKYLFWQFYNASLYKNMKPLYDSLNKVFQCEVTWDEFFDLLDFEDREAIEDILDKLDYTLISDEYSLPNMQI